MREPVACEGDSREANEMRWEGSVEPKMVQVKHWERQWEESGLETVTSRCGPRTAS